MAARIPGPPARGQVERAYALSPDDLKDRGNSRDGPCARELRRESFGELLDTFTGDLICEFTYTVCNGSKTSMDGSYIDA